MTRWPNKLGSSKWEAAVQKTLRSWPAEFQGARMNGVWVKVSSRFDVEVTAPLCKGLVTSRLHGTAKFLSHTTPKASKAKERG